MSFTQIDDFFIDLGKTQLLYINYKTEQVFDYNLLVISILS